jgi:poly-gamma-glutamate biosynthesis protein PgsC/CapC
MVEVALGMGLVLSILFSEVLGLAAGGMVIPGYLALEISNPGRILATFACAGLTYAIVHGASTFMLIYGRRRTAAMLLVGFVLRLLWHQWALSYGPVDTDAVAVVGHIVPGLIAMWMARQGIVETTCTAVMAAVIVRLALILLASTGVFS